jgi:arabinofuranosyltransferase
MSRKLFLGLAFLAFALIFLRTAWIGDDVYITLRTVDNFVHGYGLVWNVAERVQSYTHPLWMFFLTLIYLPTRDAYFTALFASFLASLATFWLVARNRSFAALGVLTLLFSKAFTDFSASGLENPLTHLLLALFFIAFIEKESSPFRLALLAALIALNRQDAILFVLPALAFLVVPQDLSCLSWRKINFAVLRDLFLGFLPLLLWELFSLFYYGFLFPNTYYAKLGTGIPTSELIPQGLTYLLDSLQRDPLTLTVIAAGIIIALWRGQIRERLVALGVLLYLAYVLIIGGDFMSGRFLTAAFLLSVFLLMRLLANLTPRWQYATLGAVVLLGLFATPPTIIIDLSQPRFTERDLVTGINDERAYYYPISGFLNYSPGRDIPFSGEGWVEHGKALRESGKSVVDEKNVGYIGYFAGPRVHIVDLYALCDPLLARLPTQWSDGWRIGHYERTPPDGYLQSLRTGVNQIADPNLAAYYDQLSLVTRGPLFSRARLVAIWKFNTGQFDYLLSNE